ncbi:MAG: hypothetical protein ABIK09_19670 [Pseudomonadota bacterium]
MTLISGVSKRIAEPAAVVGIYALLTIGLHYESVQNIGSCVIGGVSLDTHLHLWDFWWAWHAFTTPDASFFDATCIFSPPGISLWQGNSGFLLSFFTVPIRWVTGDPILTYNVTLLASLWMTCIGGYSLTRSLVGSRGAALCAGTILAFNPLVAAQINAGYLEYVNLGFGAFFILSTIKLLDEGGTRWALLSILFFCMAMAWAWYVGVFLILFTALLFAFRYRTLLGRLGAWASARDLVLWAGGIGAFVLAVYISIQAPEVQAERAAREAAFEDSLEDIDRIVIEPIHDGSKSPLAVYDRAGENLYDGVFPVQWLELKIVNSLYPASLLRRAENPSQARFHFLAWLIPLVLFVVALIDLRDAKVRFLAACACAFVLLALGPFLVCGEEVFVGTYRWMPYSLLSGVVPGVDRIQFPSRFLFGALFALAPLAGFGLRRIATRRWPGRRRSIWLYALVLGGLSLSYIHDQEVAESCEEIEVPEFYQNLGDNGDDLAIIEVPFERSLDFRDHKLPTAIFSTYQTYHGKRRLTGHVPAFLVKRRYPIEIQRDPLLDALERWSILFFDRERAVPPVTVDVLGRATVEESIESLRRFGFRYIVVHEWSMPLENYEGVRSLLDDALGPPERDESTGDTMDIYRL